MEDLPDMTVGRYGHGCAAFTMDQEQVTDQRNLLSLLNAFQIYLVAGGCGRWQFLADAVSHTDTYRDEECIEYLASTEVYRGGLWITVEPLPVAVMGVRGAGLDSTVYMTGESSVPHKFWLKFLLKVVRIGRRTTGQRSGDTLLRAAPGHPSST